ncbi:MAG: ABC transporter permease, partial [Candidatus Latescibacteria bacterium]|nr:ABC transporter permease [Candidatus Latescibacterota bacterium]
LFGMWPNLVRTPSLPLEGIRGALIYGKKGWYSDFNGMDVEGQVVLMDFNSSNNWLNPAMLGARAIVFIEPDSTVYMEAEDKFLTVPLSVPRFWIGKEDGRALLDLLERGPVQVAMKGRMIWERVPAKNILGWIPGTDPVLKDDVIVLESYYDGMSVVPALAPSAEMSSGIAALLELAHFFREHPPSRTLLFLATTGHHFGLRGIDAFLQRHDRKEDPFIERMTKSFNRFDEGTGEEKTEEGPRIKLFIGLDLSSKTDELGVWNSSTEFYFKRYFAPYGRKFMAISKEVSKALGRNPKHTLANGISPESGMSWQTYVPGDISVDSELVLAAGTPALSFVTINDARFAVDTPLDTPSKVHIGNLTRQVRFLAGLFHAAFGDPEFFPDFQMRLKDKLMTLDGSIMTFPRRSIVPDRPRKRAVAVLHNGKKKSYKGVRGAFYEVVDEEGRFEISRVRVRNVELEGFYMDPYSGDITYAPDRGVQGDQAYPMRFSMDWRYKKWMIVVFPCMATDFYDIVDPRYLTKLTTINVFDETNSSPVEFGYSIGMQAVGNEATRPVGVVFTRPETRVKIAMGSGLIGFRFLLLNSVNAVGVEAAKGAGYRIDAPGSFVRTSFLAARDMWALDEARMKELSAYGIENYRLTQLHGLAEEQITKAEDAFSRKQWDAFVRHTRSALGIESRAYPDVKATQNDVIRGIIFFMALVIPFAYFGERLLFAFPQITKQIAGFAVIFLAIWLILWWVHPAFQLSNPAVILLAFVILALAVLVMVLISSKFNRQMRALRTEIAMVHEADVGRLSASYAAFSLGISNMKRRKMRTVLTFVTLLLLTFTVLSFTSVKSTLEFNQLSRDNEGLYEGALIRNKSWNPLEEAAYEYARSNFQEIATIAPRNWYISRQKNYIKVKAGAEKSANALGVLGMTSEETNITGLDRHLIAGRWFREDDHRVCILPNDMLKDTLLDFDLADVGEMQVRLFGERFTVIGVMDPKKMKILEDLDDEILTPADFQLTGGQAVQEMAEEEQRQKQGLENPRVAIKPFVHLEPANVLIVPYQTLRDVGGALQSVAIRFDEGVDVRRQVKDFVTRLAVTVFAG